MEQLDKNVRNTVPKSFTESLLKTSADAHQGVTNQSVNRSGQTFEDKPNDANMYLTFLLQRSNYVLDTANSEAGAQRLTALRDLWKSNTIASERNIQQDIQEHWECSIRSGIGSGLNQLHALQCVDEYRCATDGCEGLLRDMDCLQFLNLSIPSGASPSEQFTIQDLITAYLQQDNSSYISGFECTNCHKSQWKEQRRSLVHVPDFLFVGIDRTVKDMNNQDQDTSISATITTAEAIPLINKVYIPQKMLVSDLTTVGALHCEQTFERNDGGIYRLLGMLVYDSDMAHWTAYVRLGSKNDGPFYCFNDFPPNAPPPTQEDPWQKLNEPGSNPTMLLYKKEPLGTLDAEESNKSSISRTKEITDCVQNIAKQDVNAAALLELLEATLKAIPDTAASSVCEIFSRHFDLVASTKLLGVQAPMSKPVPAESATSTGDPQAPTTGSPPPITPLQVTFPVDPVRTFEPRSGDGKKRRHTTDHHQATPGTALQFSKAGRTDDVSTPGSVPRSAPVGKLAGSDASDTRKAPQTQLPKNRFSAGRTFAESSSEEDVIKPGRRSTLRAPPVKLAPISKTTPASKSAPSNRMLSFSKNGTPKSATPSRVSSLTKSVTPKSTGSKTGLTPKTDPVAKVSDTKATGKDAPKTAITPKTGTASNPQTVDTTDKETPKATDTPGNKTIRCIVAEEFNCEEMFARKDASLRHARRMHTKTPVWCPFREEYKCDKRFGSDKEAKRHASGEHIAYKEKCPAKSCTYGTNDTGLMKRHLTNKHTQPVLDAWLKNRALEIKGRGDRTSSEDDGSDDGSDIN